MPFFCITFKSTMFNFFDLMLFLPNIIKKNAMCLIGTCKTRYVTENIFLIFLTNCFFFFCITFLIKNTL